MLNKASYDSILFIFPLFSCEKRNTFRVTLFFGVEYTFTSDTVTKKHGSWTDKAKALRDTSLNPFAVKFSEKN